MLSRKIGFSCRVHEVAFQLWASGNYSRQIFFFYFVRMEMQETADS